MLRVAVLQGVGANFASGLDLMKFVPVWSGAAPAPIYKGIDPPRLKVRCSHPIVAMVSRFAFTVGIEPILAGDIISLRTIACQPARDLEINVTTTVKD